MRIFRAPEFLGTAFLLAVLGMLVHVLLEALSMLADALAMYGPSSSTCSRRCCCCSSFAMLSQRRILSLINLFAAQGFVLFRLDAAGRLAHRPEPPVLLGGADAGAQGDRCCPGSCTA